MLKNQMRSREGFTLIEILVALILIALLLGAVVPAVMNQVAKGDTNRVLEDLDAVSTGAQTFRMDVRRWPSELEHLVTTISTSDNMLGDGGGTYTTGMVNRWDGAYLDGVSLTPSSTLLTGADGAIQNAFSTAFQLNSETYLAVAVSDLPASQRTSIDVAVDGAASDTLGRVRVSGTDLYYLATPIR